MELVDIYFISIMLVGLLVLTGIVWLMWLKRAYRLGITFLVTTILLDFIWLSMRKGVIQSQYSLFNWITWWIFIPYVWLVLAIALTMAFYHKYSLKRDC